MFHFNPNAGLGYALVPKLADYVLNAYNWQCVNAFFALLCFVSSIFGVLLKPVSCCSFAQTQKANHSCPDEVKQITLIIDESVHEDTKEKTCRKSYINKKPRIQANYSQNLAIFVNATEHKISMPEFQDDRRIPNSRSANILNVSFPHTYPILERTKNEITLAKNASFCLTGLSQDICHSEHCSNLSKSSLKADMLAFCNVSGVCLEDIDAGQKTNNLSSSNRMIINLTAREDTYSKSQVVKFGTHIKSFFKSAILQDFFFVCLCVSNILVFLGLGIPFAFGPDMMVQKNIMSSENGSNLIIPIGLTSMIVMPVIGILIDHGPKLNPILITAASLVSAGLSMFTFVICKTELEAIMIAVWFGLSFSAILSLPPVILETLVGEKEMKSAFSILVLLRGISIWIGSPLAGIIYDYTSIYDGAFYFAGTLFLVASIPLLTIYWKKRNN